MKTVYFVRHAEPNYRNHDDMTRELTEKGQADTRLVRDFLADRGVEAVFSSPYKRAVDTVRPFAEEFGHEIKTVNDFRERKVGEGWIENFREFSERQWADFAYCLPSGECLREVEDRNIAALEEIFRTDPGLETFVVGSHGTALSTAIHHYVPSFGCDDFYRLGKMPWIVEFRFETGACVEIVSHDLFQSTAEKLL